ncbi:peptidase M23 [Leptospira santarosai serovar Guaricura]|uniref:peptidase M23 n=2 Tax=Leptospira santarosai TaxID=28183 RepID=UPI00095C70E6|nr:peptidase M23 [Leptospira santarosai]OLY61216.1 peptidase M23 [Leptospira santarosai serovar Guaricura]
MPSLKEELDIGLLEKQQAWHEARGRLSPSKILNANQLTTCNASNRINALAQTIYGNGAYIVDNAELQTLQTQITSNGQNQTYWQNEISGTNGGFNFNGRTTTSQTKTAYYTDVRDDISIATTLQAEVVDEERGYLKTANDYFEKSEKYQELADKAKSEAKFDEAALYTGYAVREKNNALGYLKKKYYALGEEITSEVDNRGLNFTKNSFLSYRDTLLNKNFQNTTQVQKQIQEGKNQVAGIIAEGESYNQIQGMIQTAQNLNHQGEENKERVEKLLKESQELANRDISGGLLDGLQEMIASIQGSLPQEVSANGVSQYIQAQEKELEEKQSKVNELLSHMNSLVTNQNDLSNLQALLQGSNQGLNLAANSAVSKYLDDYAKKLQKDNEERSSQLQKTLLEALTNGDQYKYLREAGYGFRTDGEGISAYRQIHSGEIAIDGSAMKETSYSPELEYQYIRMETKFNPGNLSVDMMNPNNTRFNAEMVLGLKGYIDNLQKNVETMFAQFSDKTEEIKEEYAQNQEIESYQKKLYEASKENYVAAFQGLPGDLGKTFQQEMNGLKGYHEQGSKYNFNEGSFKDQSGDMKKVGKSMYDGANIEDTVFAGSRELKGTVNIKGIPIEMSYGMQHLLVTSGFNISNLGFNFKLKGVGTNYVDNQLSGANQKYSIYSEDISARIERQAKSNDEEKESKGFLFTILNGMNGGSGSMGQRFTQAVRSEAQSRITGAVAEATGLPASLVGALVGGSSMKDAVKAYVKDEATNAISKATGIPAWMISNQMEKMNKPKEQWYQSQEFQMVTTVVAVAAAPFTGGASLLVAMSIGAGIGAATGAASGGLKGALVGAVGGAAGAAVKSFTGGAVTVGLSYSAENGFGASVGVGYGPATVSVGISERGGTTVDLGLKSGAFNAGLSYNSKTRSVSGNAGLTTEGGTGFALSYNEGDGFGASISKSLDSGVNGSLSWSQKGGLGGSIGYEAPGDKNQPKNSLANQMKGAGGSLSFNQRDGVSASVSASGGVNAGNWSQSGGFQANTNFLADQWKADFVSKQGEIEALQSQGLSKEQATAILDARAQEESKAAQNKNNQETGKSVLDGVAISTQRREEDDYSQNHGDIDNDGKNKGSGVDPTKLEVNQYERFQNRDGAAESLSKGVNETNPAIAGQYKDGQMHKEFTAEIDLKRSKIAENEKNLNLADKNKMNDLMKQRADIQSQYDAISMNGKVSDKTTELLKLKAQTLTNQINDIRVGDAFGYRGSEAHNQTQLMEKMVQLKEKEAYGILTSNEKKNLAKVTSGLESYQRYGQVRDLILNNNISSTQLGSTTTAAICFVNAHSNYQGVDTKTNYFLQAQSGNIGMTNSDYRGMKSPALGIGSGWSMDLTKLSNPTSGEVHVTRTQVDILNRSGANNAIVFTDTTGDGNPNHWQRVVRDKDGVWQDINNNRKDKNELRPMDFSKVYQIKYNDNW